MTDCFLGEIRIFSYSWAPRGWALCNGALLSVQQSSALYSLLGNRYGGDGRTTFALPDLQGRTWYGQGVTTESTKTVYSAGQTFGSETVTLTDATIPHHNHVITATTADGSPSFNPAKGSAIFAQPPVGQRQYALKGSGLQPLNPKTISPTGGGVAHPNMQPFAVVNFCIATTGIYPTRN